MKTGTWIGVALALAAGLVPAAKAADRAAVQRAVDRGASYLKGAQQKDGTWNCPEIGATALAGLALLEAGVPADDPAVRKAAQAVRDQSPPLTKTYSLSLSIMFLDRLGDPADAELIESMAVRLLAGQNPVSGGWGYECPALGNAEVQRLQQSLRQRDQAGPRLAQADAPKGRPSAQDLPREIQQQLRLINQQQATPAALATTTVTDNSNTQFAVLALWIARRKGIPVEMALQRLDTRFRSSQQVDGGWTYTHQVSPAPQFIQGNRDQLERMGYVSSPAMTCAGLLGLALGHGSALETTLRTAPPGGEGTAPRGTAARDLSRDPVVRKGLLALGSFLAQAAGTAPGNPANPGPAPAGTGRGRFYYFLFSLERVGVAYGLETIGDRDWYAWGSDLLLREQGGNGAWSGEYAEYSADTCFALLFLQRANLAKDLTATLKGRVTDPGKRELHSVDVEDLGKAGGPPKETRPGSESAADGEAARLGDELAAAAAGEQERLLQKLRDGKGAVYTDALAHAIHRLGGAIKSQAREALADRLTRMKSATLDDKLRDEETEVRRAAALACAMKEEKEHAPRLIELLEDPEPEVVHAAHAALKSLSNQDFGPARDATRAEVAAAVAAWKVWWGKNGSR
jgi:hypothetical protein